PTTRRCTSSRPGSPGGRRGCKARSRERVATCTVPPRPAFAHQLLQVREEASLGEGIHLRLHIRIARRHQLGRRGRPGRTERRDDALLALEAMRDVAGDLLRSRRDYWTVRGIERAG